MHKGHRQTDREQWVTDRRCSEQCLSALCTNLEERIEECVVGGELEDVRAGEVVVGHAEPSHLARRPHEAVHGAAVVVVLRRVERVLGVVRPRLVLRDERRHLERRVGDAEAGCLARGRAVLRVERRGRVGDVAHGVARQTAVVGSGARGEADIAVLRHLLVVQAGGQSALDVVGTRVGAKEEVEGVGGEVDGDEVGVLAERALGGGGRGHVVVGRRAADTRGRPGAAAQTAGRVRSAATRRCARR